jgi:hypothetical protein
MNIYAPGLHIYAAVIKHPGVDGAGFITPQQKRAPWFHEGGAWG